MFLAPCSSNGYLYSNTPVSPKQHVYHKLETNKIVWGYLFFSMNTKFVGKKTRSKVVFLLDLVDILIPLIFPGITMIKWQRLKDELCGMFSRGEMLGRLKTGYIFDGVSFIMQYIGLIIMEYILQVIKISKIGL